MGFLAWPVRLMVEPTYASLEMPTGGHGVLEVTLSGMLNRVSDSPRTYALTAALSISSCGAS